VNYPFKRHVKPKFYEQLNSVSGIPYLHIMYIFVTLNQGFKLALEMHWKIMYRTKSSCFRF